jgi:hypothetical protein
VGRCTYVGEWRDLVVRSLITLKALTYEPAGAICAVPTTSLTEAIDGTRNWVHMTAVVSHLLHARSGDEPSIGAGVAGTDALIVGIEKVGVVGMEDVVIRQTRHEEE